MRSLAPVLLVLAFGGCASGVTGGRFDDESDKSYYAVYWKQRMAEHPIPPEVLQQADAYYYSVPWAKRTTHLDKARANFSDGFFQGMLNPDGSMTSTEVDGPQGYLAGQRFARSHPDKIPEMMEGYGYTPVQADGVWTVAFETSAFEPAGPYAGEKWWVSFMQAPDLNWLHENNLNWPNPMSRPPRSALIHLSGYLSPKGSPENHGGYGHLGGCDREVFVTELERKTAN